MFGEQYANDYHIKAECDYSLRKHPTKCEN